MTWRNPKKKEGKRDLFIGYGMEAYQALGSRKEKQNAQGKSFKKGEDAYHLILLAKTKEGFQNLLRISDDAHRTGFHYDARVDLELLKKYHEGLICTTACAGSLPNQRLIETEGEDKGPIMALHKIFGDDLFIEIHTYDTDEQRWLNQVLVEIANTHKIPLIYANDAHYTTPDLYDFHEALICAQYNEYLLAPKKHSNVPEDPTLHHPQCLYIMDEEEVRERLNHLPEWAVDEAIDNSDALMELCKFEIDKPGLYLPKFVVPKEYEDSGDMLEALVAEGLAERYELTDDVLDRAEFEYEAIVSAGLQDYFLIVWDYINYALNHGVMVGPGRGSVGGSILAYALGITSIDPLKYDLQFERFWNPGRAEGLPDIDVDFEQSARQFMISYVRRKYGDDRVLPIGNHIFLRPMSAIDKAGMVLYANPPYGAITNIKNVMKTTIDAGQMPPWDEMWEQLGERAEKAGEDHPLEEYKRKYPDLFELAEGLAGRISTYGIHASAVVISAVDLADHLPARMASDDDKKKTLVTQAEMKQVEKAGFPKFDFLGLRNLDTIMMTAILSGEFGDPDVLGPKLLKLIDERQRGSVVLVEEELRQSLVAIVKHFRNDVNYNTLPDSYWMQIDNSYTLGLFQIEEGGSPKRIGKHLHPRHIEDLAAIVALNRPGPLRDKDEKGDTTVDRFLARRNGDEETVYPHPILEDILEPTYGDFLYQEQVIAYFRKIGYSLSDADHIRKILGKKLVKEMQAELPTYLKAATQHMPKQTAEFIWHKIEEFSKYSFNKAHAVGYGMILAWTMYAKWKWPTEFVMASIATNPKKVAAYIGEGRRIGAKFLPPDINRSQATISKVDDSIPYGLRDIKGIGEDAAAWIVQNRPYESPEDFYRKCTDDDRKVTVNGKKTIIVKANHRTALMDAGAFDSFGYRLALCSECEGKGKVAVQVPKKNGEGTKRSLVPCSVCNLLGYEPVDLPDLKTKAALEEELLGISITEVHQEVIDQHLERIQALDSYAEADTEEKVKITVPGVVKLVDVRMATWPVEPGVDPKWARVTIEWQGEQLTFAAFPKIFKGSKELMRPGSLNEFKLETGKKGPRLIKVTPYHAIEAD